MQVHFNDEFQKNQSATLKGELITANTSQYLSRVKDAVAARDWGAGEPVAAYYYVTPAAALNPGTSIQVQIVGSDTLPNVNGTDGTNAVVLADSGAVAVALLGAGTYHFIGFLKSGSLKRYLAAKVIEVGGAPNTGAIVCGLLEKNARLQSYGDTTNSI